MDPLSIAAAVDQTVIAPLTRKLLEKTVDPEKVAESVSWLFLAVDHFLKVRNHLEQKEALITPPPQAVPPDKLDEEISQAQVDGKAAAVEEIARALQPAQPVAEGGVGLENLSEYEMDYLDAEIDSVLEQLESSLRKLQVEQEKVVQSAAQETSSPAVIPAIRSYQNQIATLLLRLNRTMKKAYGVATPNLYQLVSATEGKG